MRIGIDARFYGKAGPGRYTKNIVKHLEKVDKSNDYFIFLRKDGFKQYIPENDKFIKVLSDYPWYSFDEQTKFLFLLLRYKLDLFYVPHFNIPVLYPGKIVTAIPDMTMHTYSTQRGTTLPIWYFKIKKIIYKFVFWLAVARSFKVIVPSQNVISDFLKNLKFKQNKYILAYEGIDPDFLVKVGNPQDTLKKYGIKAPFILCVGSMYEHKNVEGLIEAYKILKNKYDYKGQLILVSKKDKFSQRIFETLKSQKLDEDVLVLAYRVQDNSSDIVVSDREITALRQCAQVYTMAAFKEGFSLTALEAMVCGLPAALSDIECHHEVYGDSVIYFDPHNPRDIADKINILLTDESVKKMLIQKGFEQIKKYNWLNTAKITLSVFMDAVKQTN